MSPPPARLTVSIASTISSTRQRSHQSTMGDSSEHAMEPLSSLTYSHRSLSAHTINSIRYARYQHLARYRKCLSTRLASDRILPLTRQFPQQQRFSDKESKALKGTKFPKEFNERVDMRKVNLTSERERESSEENNIGRTTAYTSSSNSQS
jgi:hypothetical protein